MKMSKALLQEIYLTMLADEQADFANAERHKAAMEATGNPLEYDYSDGWTQTYQPPAPSAATAKDTKPAASADGSQAAAPATSPSTPAWTPTLPRPKAKPTTGWARSALYCAPASAAANGFAADGAAMCSGCLTAGGSVRTIWRPSQRKEKRHENQAV